MTGELREAILKGSRRAAARLMRLIDDDAPQARATLTALMPYAGDAYILGVTGNPGSGKSTLVSRLIARFRERGDTVGCIAIDPTSPFSGGAILGDRVRMQEHAEDDGVFIRSVATRGSLGGLSRSTPAMVQVLDAMGFDTVIVETVGVGQDEVEIIRLADTSLVTLVPGLGDDIQADKAGLMEIADVFVLNKSDLPGSQHLKRRIQTMLSLHQNTDAARSAAPAIVATSATSGDGIDELFAEVEIHRRSVEKDQSRQTRLQKRHTHLIRAIARSELEARFDEHVRSDRFSQLVDDLAAGQIDPYKAASQLLSWLAE